MIAYLEDRFSFVRNLGIYACRDVVGGDTRSHHAEGRGNDIGIPMNGSSARPELGLKVVQLLGPHGKRLGIDHMIYNRVAWSAQFPQGHPYKGLNPHRDHVHLGLNRSAAKSLTYATLVAILGPVTANPTPPPKPKPPVPPKPTPPPTGVFTLQISRSQIQKGSSTGHGGDVAIAQGLLHAWGYGSTVGTVDGVFGNNTDKATRQFQSKKGLTSDGVIGEATWKALES